MLQNRKAQYWAAPKLDENLLHARIKPVFVQYKQSSSLGAGAGGGGAILRSISCSAASFHVPVIRRRRDKRVLIIFPTDQVAKHYEGKKTF